MGFLDDESGLIGGLGKGIEAGIKGYYEAEDRQYKRKGDLEDRDMKRKEMAAKIKAAESEALTKRNAEDAGLAGKGRIALRDESGRITGTTKIPMTPEEQAKDQAELERTRAQTRHYNRTGFPTKEKTAEAKPPSSDQFKAGTFARRLEQAENVFSGLDKTGYDPTSRLEQAAGFLPGEGQSTQFQSLDQAQRNFVTAVLRRESGAAISPQEFETAKRQYFPQAGDSAKVKAQKKANRLQAFHGLRVESGGAYDQIPLISPEEEDGQGLINQGLQGPNGKQGGLIGAQEKLKQIKAQSQAPVGVPLKQMSRQQKLKELEALQGQGDW